MSYEHIIAARQRLHAMGVPHLAFGGLGQLTSGVGGLVGGVVGGLTGGITDASGLKNTYQATTPTLSTTDYAPTLAQALGGYSAGQNTLAGAAGSLQGVGAGQTAAAGNIGAQAGNVAGLAGAGGLGGVLSQQQTLAQALQAQANGQGPNPAQDQFKSNLNNAIAQNASAVASTKGINPAPAAMISSGNAAQMEGQAAGNAATLQAQQQLAAQSALGQQLQAEGSTVLGQGSLYNTAGNLYGGQSSALGQAGTTYGQIGSIGAQQAGQANNLYGTAVSGQTGQNNSISNNSIGAQKIDASVAANNTTTQGQIVGGLLQGAGGMATKAIGAGADGGLVHDGEITNVDGKALTLAQALMAQGGQVPGQAAVQGNSLKNDVVPAVLSPGEIVLPRSVTQSADPAAKAAAFVESLKAKAHPGYGKVLEARRRLEAAHQAFCQGGAA